MKLGFIGTGKIASSVITGVCGSSIKYSKIFISSRNNKIAKGLKKKFKKITIEKDNQKIVDNSNWVFLAVTPTVGEKIIRNLKFRPKKYDKKCIAASLEIKPKVFLSVVGGPGMYSSPGGITKDRDQFDDYPDSNEFVSFEVAIIDENLDDEFQEWQVKGWQTRDDINKLIKETLEEN